jgi:hypothetical protein
MKAKLLPLKGKYYGTEIELYELGGTNRDTAEFSIWIASGEPSIRELTEWGVSQKEWDANGIVDDGWGGTAPVKSVGHLCDSHYECALTYRVAKIVVDAINGE